MAIVLEGPDNSGKTTLAKAIAERLGWEYIHVGGPCKSKDEADLRLLRDIDLMQQKIVMDRSFIISDTIYGPVVRNERLFDPRPWMRKIQALDIHDENFHLIFCTAPEKVICDMTHHIVKPHETEQHVAQMIAKRSELYWNYKATFQAMSLFLDCIEVNPREQQDEIVADIHCFYGD